MVVAGHRTACLRARLGFGSRRAEAGCGPPRSGSFEFDDGDDLIDGFRNLAVVIDDDVVVVGDIGELFFELCHAGGERGGVLAITGDEAGAEGFTVFGHEEDEDGAFELFAPSARTLDVGADDHVAALGEGAGHFVFFDAFEVAVDSGGFNEPPGGDAAFEFGTGEEVIVDAVAFALAWGAARGTGGTMDARTRAQFVDDGVLADAGGAVENDDDGNGGHCGVRFGDTQPIAAAWGTLPDGRDTEGVFTRSTPAPVLARSLGRRRQRRRFRYEFRPR